MKVVVIGATGRTGEQLVSILRRAELVVLEASPTRGVDAVTGEGLDRALAGAAVVIDVSNAPSMEGPAALRFFEAAGRNLSAAAQAAGVGHYIALSVVGTDSLQASDYFRGKKLQEDLVRGSGIPFTCAPPSSSSLSPRSCRTVGRTTWRSRRPWPSRSR